MVYLVVKERSIYVRLLKTGLIALRIQAIIANLIAVLVYIIVIIMSVTMGRVVLMSPAGMKPAPVNHQETDTLFGQSDSKVLVKIILVTTFSADENVERDYIAVNQTNQTYE